MSEIREWLLQLVGEAHQERSLGVAGSDIDRWESDRGFLFPSDYRAALEEFAGVQFGYLKVAFRAEGFTGGARPCALFSPGLLDEASGHLRVEVNRNLMEAAFEDQSQGRYGNWQTELLPFAGSGATGWFCFDYRSDADSPPVVYVTDEHEWFPPPDSGWGPMSGVSYVADSFAEFVGLMISQEQNPPKIRELRWEEERVQQLLATEPSAPNDD